MKSLDAIIIVAATLALPGCTIFHDDEPCGSGMTCYVFDDTLPDASAEFYAECFAPLVFGPSMTSLPATGICSSGFPAWSLSDEAEVIHSFFALSDDIDMSTIWDPYVAALDATYVEEDVVVLDREESGYYGGGGIGPFLCDFEMTFDMELSGFGFVLGDYGWTEIDGKPALGIQLDGTDEPIATGTIQTQADCGSFLVNELIEFYLPQGYHEIYLDNYELRMSGRVERDVNQVAATGHVSFLSSGFRLEPDVSTSFSSTMGDLPTVLKDYAGVDKSDVADVWEGMLQPSADQLAEGVFETYMNDPVVGLLQAEEQNVCAVYLDGADNLRIRTVDAPTRCL